MGHMSKLGEEIGSLEMENEQLFTKRSNALKVRESDYHILYPPCPNMPDDEWLMVYSIGLMRRV